MFLNNDSAETNINLKGILSNSPIKRTVMVIAETETAMQGIIRAIEALDESQHRIGIIHGAARNKVEEVDVILAELAQALIITTANVERVKHPAPGKAIDYFVMNVPNDVLSSHDYNVVKEWLLAGDFKIEDLLFSNEEEKVKYSPLDNIHISSQAEEDS